MNGVTGLLFFAAIAWFAHWHQETLHSKRYDRVYGAVNFLVFGVGFTLAGVAILVGLAVMIVQQLSLAGS